MPNLPLVGFWAHGGRGTSLKTAFQVSPSAILLHGRRFVPQLVWRASPFPLIVQHRMRKRVWYNCYSGFVQDLTFRCLQSDCRTRKNNLCVTHMLKRNNTYECDYEQPMTVTVERCRQGEESTQRRIIRTWRGIAKSGIPKPICYLAQLCLYFAHLVRSGNGLL